MFFECFFLKTKITDILNFYWIKHLGKGLSYWKNLGTEVNYCWSYRTSKLLLHFIGYSPDQLNNKPMKITANSKRQFSESHYQMKCLVKVCSFSVHPPQRFKIFAKLNRKYILMANIFKLQLQTFGLMKMCNMSKIWFGNNKSSLRKRLIYDWRGVKNAIF